MDLSSVSPATHPCGTGTSVLNRPSRTAAGHWFVVDKPSGTADIQTNPLERHQTSGMGSVELSISLDCAVVNLVNDSGDSTGFQSLAWLCVGWLLRF